MPVDAAGLNHNIFSSNQSKGATSGLSSYDQLCTVV